MDQQRRDRLLAFCRLEEFREDTAVMALVDALYQAAVGYLDAAGVREPAPDTPRAAQYELLVNFLVLDWYDHRDRKEPTSQNSENIAFRQMLNQMKLEASLEGFTPPPPEGGTSPEKGRQGAGATP